MADGSAFDATKELNNLEAKMDHHNRLKEKVDVQLVDIQEKAQQLSNALATIYGTLEDYRDSQIDIAQTVSTLRKQQKAADELANAEKLKDDRTAVPVDTETSVHSGNTSGANAGAHSREYTEKDPSLMDSAGSLKKGIPYKRPEVFSNRFTPKNPRKSSRSTSVSSSKVASSGSSSSTKPNAPKVFFTMDADGFTPVNPKKAFRPYTMKPTSHGRVVVASMSPDSGSLGSNTPKKVPDDDSKQQTKTVKTNPNLQKEKNGTASKPEGSAKGKVIVPVAPPSQNLKPLAKAASKKGVSPSSLASDIEKEAHNQTSARPKFSAESAPLRDLANTGGPVAAGTVPSGDSPGTSQSFESTEPKGKGCSSEKKVQDPQRQESQQQERKAKMASLTDLPKTAEPSSAPGGDENKKLTEQELKEAATVLKKSAKKAGKAQKPVTQASEKEAKDAARAAKEAAQEAKAEQVKKDSELKSKLDNMFKCFLREWREKNQTIKLAGFNEADAKTVLADRVSYHKRKNYMEVSLLLTVMLENMCPYVLEFAYHVREFKKDSNQECLDFERDQLAFIKSSFHYEKGCQFYRSGNVKKAMEYAQDFVKSYTATQADIRSGKAQYHGDPGSKNLLKDIRSHKQAKNIGSSDWENARKFFVTYAQYFRKTQQGFYAMVFDQLAMYENPVLKQDVSILEMLYEEKSSEKNQIIHAYATLVTSVCNL